jgi:gamma-glutamylputrescine oxidase
VNHEPTSYWQRSVLPTRLSVDLPSVVDVAVVGGGVLGAATGYWLARAGAAVVLLERTGLASGATGRNGGIVSIGTAESYPRAIARLGHATVRAVWMLTLENRALLHQVLSEERIACDYREVGHLSLAVGEEHRRRIRADGDSPPGRWRSSDPA